MSAEVDCGRSQRTREAGRRWLELGRLVVVVVGDREGDIALFMAGLTAAGVEVHAFRDGSGALLHCGRNLPDVVLLNARLHDITSAQWTQAVRQKSTLPILVGVERADADAAGPALLAGGTSVVGRPYSAEEVLTSLSALQSAIAARRAAEGVLRHGPLEVDLQAFSARFRGRELGLPLKELELLRLLLVNAGRVLAAEEIMEALWGPHPRSTSTSALKTHVQRLRAHIGDRAAVRTVRGHGYTLGYFETESQGSDPAAPTARE